MTRHLDELLGAGRIGFAAYVDALSPEVLLMNALHCALVVGAVMWITTRHLRAKPPAR